MIGRFGKKYKPDNFIPLILLKSIFILDALISAHCMAQMNSSTSSIIHIPAEWDRHNGTYMVYPASAKIWKKFEYLKLVREDIVRIAIAISKYEPVTMLVDPDQLEDARKSINNINNIEILSIPVDDLWARDTLPVFGFNSESKDLVGVEFNFNGWGGKQEHAKDGKVARTLLDKLGISRIETKLVGEGGSLETDGEGTLLITESSILNENRNPSLVDNRDEIEKELKRVLGMQKVIWFDGVYGEDITDAHVDCLVRFARPGVVILNRPPEGSSKVFDVWSNSSDQAKLVLERETDAKGRKFEVIEMYEPDPKNIVTYGEDFLSSYVNFYIANGAVIVPKFGDKKADLSAQEILRSNFPGRDIVPVEISNLASGGGGIHCATHDLPCNSKAKNDGLSKPCGSGAGRHKGFWLC